KFLEKQLRLNVAARGWLETSYYYLGSDYRAGGGLRYTLSYMSQMGGWSLLDYALWWAESSEKMFDMVQLGYASYLSSWALLNSGRPETDYGYWYPGKENDGAAGGGFEPLAWARGWNGKWVPRGAWNYSAEEDIGYCGAVRAAACVVAEDPIFGLVAFGGRLEDRGEAVAVWPRDGLRVRFHYLKGEDEEKEGKERDDQEQKEAMNREAKENGGSEDMKNKGEPGKGRDKNGEGKRCEDNEREEIKVEDGNKNFEDTKDGDEIGKNSSEKYAHGKSRENITNIRRLHIIFEKGRLAKDEPVVVAKDFSWIVMRVESRMKEGKIRSGRATEPGAELEAGQGTGQKAESGTGPKIGPEAEPKAELEAGPEAGSIAELASSKREGVAGAAERREGHKRACRNFESSERIVRSGAEAFGPAEDHRENSVGENKENKGKEVEVVIKGLSGEYEATDEYGNKLEMVREKGGALRVWAPEGSLLLKNRDTLYFSYFLVPLKNRDTIYFSDFSPQIIRIIRGDNSGHR
ncbi:MAG: hypothetical protein ACPLRX_06475, partial [Candidatus Saccharicenans sp.]